ncbi:hypothetical protein INT45_007036 [Circinella minor]|uniref:DDE Tnp4 domain-containing protein n=1 Tax=Circinella minor TaxID=1195481 RepID=A0A8H7VAD6_9FUNG|nr:hypothetical protein INT45_007036 [Circinella minor]
MNNRTLIGQDPCTDACIMQCQTNLAVIQGAAYHQHHFQHLMDAMMEEEEKLLASHRNYLRVIDQMSFEVLGPLVAQAALRYKLVYQDIFYEIFHACPIFMTAEIAHQRQQRAYESSRWWRVTHPNLSDLAKGRKRFKSYYHIMKSAFELLVNKLKSDPEYIGSQMKGGIPVEIQVAMVLWRFANSHFGFCLVCALLDIPDGSLNNCTDRFIKAMERMGQTEITWPTNDLRRTQEMAHQFKTKGGAGHRRLDKVIGAMDGKLVIIQKPAKRGNMVVDRKNSASFNLLAVCDASTRFTFIKCGDSGRVNDARAFTTSALYTNLVNIPDQVCMDGTYIIADSAFPVMCTVVPSFPRSSANRRQKIFNKMHSSSRIVVEHSFGALVSRWRTLWKHLYMINIERMIRTIIACCVLHNICLGINDIEDPATQSDATVRLYEAFVDNGPYDVDPEGQGIEVSLEPLPLISEASSSPPVPEAPQLTTDRISIPEITRLENEL